jgi:hypothetical protein
MSIDANTSALDTHLREIARYESGVPMDPMADDDGSAPWHYDEQQEHPDGAAWLGAGLVDALLQRAEWKQQHGGRGSDFEEAARMVRAFDEELVRLRARVASLEAELRQLKGATEWQKRL